MCHVCEACRSRALLTVSSVWCIDARRIWSVSCSRTWKPCGKTCSETVQNKTHSQSEWKQLRCEDVLFEINQVLESWSGLNIDDYQGMKNSKLQAASWTSSSTFNSSIRVLGFQRSKDPDLPTRKIKNDAWNPINYGEKRVCAPMINCTFSFLSMLNESDVRLDTRSIWMLNTCLQWTVKFVKFCNLTAMDRHVSPQFASGSCPCSPSPD